MVFAGFDRYYRVEADIPPIPVGVLRDWSQFHYSSCDWDRIGKKVNGSGQDGNHNNNRSVFIYKYAVLI